MPWFRESYHAPEPAWSKRLPLSRQHAGSPEQEGIPANAAA
jgi:hypothetical protein